MQVSFTPHKTIRNIYIPGSSRFMASVVPLDVDMTVTIPQALQRFAFSVITNNRESICSDANVVSIFDYDY